MWRSMTDPAMSDIMSPDRFDQLTLAFGGDVERWPAAEREAARRLAVNQPALTEPLTAHARRLDRTLDRAPSAQPSRELRDRVIAAAPGPRATRATARRAASRWLAGLGLAAGFAGAAAAGVAAGVLVAPATLAPRHVAPVADPGDEAALLLREPSDLGEG
jgi:hypothetical protein